MGTHFGKFSNKGRSCEKSSYINFSLQILALKYCLYAFPFIQFAQKSTHCRSLQKRLLLPDDFTGEVEIFNQDS